MGRLSSEPRRSVETPRLDQLFRSNLSSGWNRGARLSCHNSAWPNELLREERSRRHRDSSSPISLCSMWHGPNELTWLSILRTWASMMQPNDWVSKTCYTVLRLPVMVQFYPVSIKARHVILDMDHLGCARRSWACFWRRVHGAHQKGFPLLPCMG